MAKRIREATAEVIDDNVRRLSIDVRPASPTCYEKMSKLMDTLIE